MPNSDNPFLSLPKVTQQQQSPTATNPFLSLPKAGEQQSSPNEQQAPVEQSQGILGQTFEDKLDIFNRGFERYALGGLQLMSAGVRNTVGYLPVVGDSVTKGTEAFDAKLAAQNQQSDQVYQEAYKRTPSPIVDFLGNVGGAVTASAPAVMATTTAGPATALNMVGQGIASGAAAGAVDYSSTTGERIAKTAFGGAIGGALPATYYGGKSVLEHFIPGNSISGLVQKMLFPADAAKKDIAQAIVLDSANNVDDALAKVSAVKASGTGGATPAELLSTAPNSQIRATEAGIKVGDAEKGRVAESIVGRTNQIKQQIYDDIASLSTPEIQQAQTNGFTAMKNDFIAPDGALLQGAAPESLNYIPEVIKTNSVLSKTFDQVRNANIPGWEDTPVNSVAFLHKVKDVIDDKLIKATPNKATGAISKAIGLIPEKELKAAKQQLTSVLEQSPAYNEAMAATNLIKRNQYYNQLIDTAKVKPGSNGTLTLEQLTDAVVPNALRQKQFIRDVVKAGGDEASTEKLLNVAQSLKGAPLWDVLKGGADKTGYAGGDKLGLVQQFISDMTLDRYYKAMLDVTLSGDKWADDIATVLSARQGNAQQKGFLALMLNAANNVEKTTRAALTTTAVEGARTMTGGRDNFDR